MKPDAFDVDRTVEYAHSHDLARQALPFALLGVLFGLFVMTPLDAAASRPKDYLLGALVIAISIAFVCAIAYRRSQPNEANIVLSPQGILFRDISDGVIPWNEIQKVGSTRITRSRDVIGVKVTTLIVSERFLDTLAGDKWYDSAMAVRGNPSEIYVSYFQPPPFAEFQEAVRRRWHAFSVHARELPPLAAPAISAPRSETAAAGRTARGNSATVQRVSSFEGVRALGALLRGSNPLQLIVIVLALAGIGALVTNQMGVWSTGAQERSRAAAAEWRAWRKRLDDEQKERDEERRRFDERMNRAFRCMDWPARSTPECRSRE